MRRFWAGLVAACGANAALAGDPAELVPQLGDPRFAVREAAFRALLKEGAAAIPAVQAALDTTDDPGIRERAESILPRLHRIADSERCLAPKLVKLAYRDVPLATVVEDLKKRTGIPLMLLPDQVALPTRPITLADGDTAPWEAVDKLCVAAGLKEVHRVELPLPKNIQTQSTYLQGRAQNFSYVGARNSGLSVYTPSTAPILLADGKPDPLPGNRGQSIRVLAMPGRFEANRVLRGSGTIVLNLDVAPQAGVNWVGSTRVRVIRAEDEDGRPLFTDEKTQVSPNPMPQFDQWGFRGGLVIDSIDYPVLSVQSAARNPRLTPMTLRTDDRAIRMLRKLEGTVVGEIHMPNEPVITIADLSQSIGESFESPLIRLKPGSLTVSKDGGTMLSIHAELPQFWGVQGMLARSQFLSEDLNIGNVQGRMRFIDAHGVFCTPQQRSARYSGTNTTQTYDTELYFPPSKGPTTDAGPPVKLVLLGTKVTTIEIPFTMENVRLP